MPNPRMLVIRACSEICCPAGVPGKSQVLSWRQGALSAGVQDSFGLQVGEVEELLQLGRGEGAFSRSRVVCLSVAGPVELSDKL